MAEPLVVLDSVTVAFGGQRALDGVSLRVSPGEVVTVVGPNGAGKTTLLKTVLGLVSPEAGSLRRRAGLRVGYVPQKLPIDPTLPLTVNRFLSLAVAERVGRERLVSVLAQVGAAHVIGRQVRDVSGGELQRVMIARAILREPELLVLDEPVGNVDVVGQAELYDRISRLRAETGCGVLMVSHDLHLVMGTTDRVICLNHHVCCAGSAHAVRNDPAYAELFGPAVAASLAVYAHSHDHSHGADGCVVPAPVEHRHG